MRLTAIVVLVLAMMTAACSQPADQGAAGQPAPGGTPASALDGTTAAGGATGAAAGGSTTTALNGVSATTPAGAAGAAATATEVTIPAGTPLAVVLDSAISSESSKVDQPVSGKLSANVEVDGAVVLPAGSAVNGVVTEVYRAGKVKGRAELSFRFTELTRTGDSEKYAFKAPAITRVAEATKKNDAVKVGGGAVGGAIVGGLIGGKKGAAVGTAAGAGAGGAAVMATRGEEVRLSQGTKVSVKLAEPLVVRVAAR
ncbi:MAG: hypothetical protein U0Q55_17915 [Vicinamibacterales bacterium]